MRISDWSSDVCSSDLGQRLEVTITDIARAGNYEPWHGINADSIRFMRDVYQPRITLDFKLVGADGNVIAQGTRALSDIAYLQTGSPLHDSDTLRYATHLIDEQSRQECIVTDLCSTDRTSVPPAPPDQHEPTPST